MEAGIMVETLPILGTCSLCLNEGVVKSMLIKQINDNKKESYTDMLFKCFSIDITILELDDTKRLICNNCIQQLETCLKFREQVETSLKALEVTVRLKKIAKSIGQNYRTLPTFEKGLFDYIFINHYSLERNELLKCRWLKYKQNIEKRVFAPFQFPNIRDLHFYNGCIRFLPNESIYRYPEHRMKLKPGPGVDFRGQMPIPQELLMKRGTIQKDNKKKKMIKQNK